MTYANIKFRENNSLYTMLPDPFSDADGGWGTKLRTKNGCQPSYDYMYTGEELMYTHFPNT